MRIVGQDRCGGIVPCRPVPYVSRHNFVRICVHMVQKSSLLGFVLGGSNSDLAFKVSSSSLVRVNSTLDSRHSQEQNPVWLVCQPAHASLCSYAPESRGPRLCVPPSLFSAPLHCITGLQHVAKECKPLMAIWLSVRVITLCSDHGP